MTQLNLLNTQAIDYRQQESWPKKIVLYALALSWDVECRGDSESTEAALHEEGSTVILSGPIHHFKESAPLWHSWLQKQAQQYIAPWIQKLSRDIEMPYEKLSFRGQKTRWGSCSANKDISLNYKLLFLPARLVRYVLIHELCHTQVLDHSRQFWEKVLHHEPDYRRLRVELKRADQYLPEWVLKFL